MHGTLHVGLVGKARQLRSLLRAKDFCTNGRLLCMHLGCQRELLRRHRGNELLTLSRLLGGTGFGSTLRLRLVALQLFNAPLFSLLAQLLVLQ